MLQGLTLQQGKTLQNLQNAGLEKAFGFEDQPKKGVDIMSTSPVDLKLEQQATLNTPRIKAGITARILFLLMDLIYGKEASLSKFRVLEIVARMPYTAWEQVSNVAITHTYSDPKFAKDIHRTVVETREQTDNETWHLLMLEEILNKKGKRHGVVRARIIPQILAWTYYHLSWLMYVVKPRVSYQLNVEFEDHAEHEYMQYVADHQELDVEVWESNFKDTYGHYDTVGDLLRRIGLDEREHKESSMSHIEQSRFTRNS